MFFFYFNGFIESVLQILTRAGIESGDSGYENGNKSSSGNFDYLGVLDEEKYGFDIKSYSTVKAPLMSINKAAKDLLAKADRYEGNIKLVLILSCALDDTDRKQLHNMYSDVSFVDISNLLYIVQDDEEIKNTLISSLSYSIDDIEPNEGPIELSWLIHSNFTENLIERMRECRAGNEFSEEYEELCYSLLKNALSNDLALWRKQQNSNADLYRFDLICRIKDDNRKTFWGIIEEFLHSKYIIFEFKNYNGQVTQKEIYATEKYLYAKALRNVAIMVAANGYNTNAKWAAKGAFRENGKLILLLDSDDLIKMNQMKIDNKDPSMFLLKCLDELLLELEK